MRQESIIILTGDSSAGINGASKDINQVVNLSVQTLASANTVIGVLKLQISNDAANTMPRSNFTPTNWVDVPNATATITAGEAHLITLTNCAYGFLRAVFTPDGGGSTGTISALMSAVGV